MNQNTDVALHFFIHFSGVVLNQIVNNVRDASNWFVVNRRTNHIIRNQVITNAHNVVITVKNFTNIDVMFYSTLTRQVKVDDNKHTVTANRDRIINRDVVRMDTIYIIYLNICQNHSNVILTTTKYVIINYLGIDRIVVYNCFEVVNFTPIRPHTINHDSEVDKIKYTISDFSCFNICFQYHQWDEPNNYRNQPLTVNQIHISVRMKVRMEPLYNC